MKMIDEKKLIRELEEAIGILPAIYLGKKDEHNAYLDAITSVLSLVKRQPKVGKWIPVEEGLPNYYEPVLVTYLYFSNQKIYDDEIAYLDVCGNWDWGIKEDIENVEIMAWMPLPEPYVKGDVEQ